MPRVNPAQLVWARETAGLTRDEAARLLKLSEVRGSSGTDRLAAIEESGEPTRPQLLAMAKLYRRPLLTFYLAEQPRPSERGEDFRTFAGDREPAMEVRLDALLRDVRARQALIRGVIAEDEDAAPVPFVGSISVDFGVQHTLAKVSQGLGVSLPELRQERDAGAVFARLRMAIEAQGVFVLLAGDLGSHHSAIDVATFRGFALADPLAPFIVVNDKDTKTAWSFTALHELVHLWLGSTGISGGGMAGSPVEQFCNEVASAFLLPATELAGLRPTIATETDPAAVMALVVRFADERKISPDMVAYRSFRAGYISEVLWTSVRQHLANRLRALRAEKKGEGGGGDYYTTRRHRLGGLVDFARRALSDGSLTPTKAALVLGVKVGMVSTLVEAT